jgi:hypothetical protein
MSWKAPLGVGFAASSGSILPQKSSREKKGARSNPVAKLGYDLTDGTTEYREAV